MYSKGSSFNYRNSRRSACDRCRGYKLRCEREHPSDDSCYRCLKARVCCVTMDQPGNDSLVRQRQQRIGNEDGRSDRNHSNKRRRRSSRSSSANSERRLSADDQASDQIVANALFTLTPRSTSSSAPQQQKSKQDDNSFLSGTKSRDRRDGHSVNQNDSPLISDFDHMLTEFTYTEDDLSLYRHLSNDIPLQKLNTGESTAKVTGISRNLTPSANDDLTNFSHLPPVDLDFGKPSPVDLDGPTSVHTDLHRLNTQLVESLDSLQRSSKSAVQMGDWDEWQSPVLAEEEINASVSRVLNLSSRLLNILQSLSADLSSSSSSSSLSAPTDQVSPDIHQAYHNNTSNLNRRPPTSHPHLSRERSISNSMLSSFSHLLSTGSGLQLPSDVNNKTNFSVDSEATIGLSNHTKRTTSSSSSSSSSPPSSLESRDILLNLTLVTSFIYLVRLYRAVFTQLYQFLLVTPPAEAAALLVLPDIQFGSFQLSKNINIKVQVLIELCTNNLRRIENTLGISYYESGNTTTSTGSTLKASIPTSSGTNNNSGERQATIISDPVSVFIRDIILSQERVQSSIPSPDGSSSAGGEKAGLKEIMNKLKIHLQSTP